MADGGGVGLHLVARGRAGAVLADVLAARRGGDRMAAATVVAPGADAVTALRRALAAAPGGVVGVRVLVLAELAELLGARALAGGGRTPLTPALRREHVRLALAAVPGALEHVATHPATAELVDEALGELRRATAAGEEDAVLAALEAAGPLPRTLAGLHRSLRAATAATSYDAADLALAAASRTGVLPQTGPVALFLPQALDPAELALVHALARRLPVDAILGLTGDPTADTPAHRLATLLCPTHPAGAAAQPAPGAATPARPVSAGDAARGAAAGGSRPARPVSAGGAAAPAVGAVAQPAPGGATPARPVSAGGAAAPAAATTPPALAARLAADAAARVGAAGAAVALRSAPDADEEVRAVVRSIAGLLRGGAAADGIAVLHGEAEPYGQLAAEHLAAAGIPAHGPVSRTLAQTPPGRVLLGLLALPDDDLARQSVFDWLALAPLHPAEGPVPVERWTAVAEEAGVARGREQWDRRLRAHLARGEGDLGATSDLLAFTQRVFGALGGPRDRTWPGFAEWAGDLLDACLGPPSARADWPAQDHDAELALRERLAALAGLDAADGGAVEVGVFRRALAVELQAPAGWLGAAGAGVFVGPVTAAAGRKRTHAFVVGMAEGAFPSRPVDQPLLPGAVRRALVARSPGLRGALATREDTVLAERAALFGVLAAAGHTTLSYPRADRRRQRERLPSAWFLELAGARAGAPRSLLADELDAGAIPGYEAIPSAAAGIEGAGEPATPAEWVARELLATIARGEDVRATPVLAGEPGLSRAVTAARARAAAAFSAWDGNVGPVPALSAHLAGPLSATRLARYATCPRQYFLSSLLGVHERESREDPFALAGSRRGLLLHQILERVLSTLIARPPTDLEGAREVLYREADRTLGPAEADAGASLPARLSAEAVRAWLERWLVEHAALAAELGVIPVGAELAFGRDADPLGAVRVALPGGRELAFRGRVDRVDASPSGGAVLVVDYKSASDEGYRGIEKDPVLGGRELQLAVYGLATAGAHPEAEVTARYWFLGPRSGKAAHRGFVLDADNRTRAVTVLDVLADGIADGAFPARPGPWDDFRGAYQHCRSCAFDRICPAPGDRERTWERDARDPAVQRYAALTEGAA